MRTGSPPATSRPRNRPTVDEVWEWLPAAYTGIVTSLRRDEVSGPVSFVVIDRRLYFRTSRRGRTVAHFRRGERNCFAVESAPELLALDGIMLVGVSRALDDDDPLVPRVEHLLDLKYSAFRSPENLHDTVAAEVVDGSATIEFTPDERIFTWDNSRSRSTS